MNGDPTKESLLNKPSRQWGLEEKRKTRLAVKTILAARTSMASGRQLIVWSICSFAYRGGVQETKVGSLKTPTPNKKATTKSLNKIPSSAPMPKKDYCPLNKPHNRRSLSTGKGKGN